MRVCIGGDEQPAIGPVLTHTAHPVPDSERLAILLNALQIADGLDVVGQHRTDTDGGFLNFFFHQVSRRCVLQIGAQLVDFDGEHGINQLLVAAVLVFAHQIRAFGKDGAP